jgi:hypothetical protein
MFEEKNFCECNTYYRDGQYDTLRILTLLIFVFFLNTLFLFFMVDMRGGIAYPVPHVFGNFHHWRRVGMTTISTSAAVENLDGLVGRIVRSKKTVKLRDGLGRFVYLVSQEELDGLKATAELRAIPGMVEGILRDGNAPDAEFIAEDEFVWHFRIKSAPV